MALEHKLIFLLHTGATFFLVGLIWTIQVVHYPMFNRVGLEAFVQYAAEHNWRISLIVVPVMLAEAGLTALLFLSRPAQISWQSALIGLVLLGIVWGTTFFLSVPQHNVLAQGFDPTAYRRLVTTNWLRTLAWTARGVLNLWWLWRIIP